jgi:diguanylate cyclase (GGDEF)-like protein
MSDAIVTLQREKQDLERLVCVDALTGIANRRHTMALLAAEWRRSARDNAPIAAVMIDLDFFHAYNEHYGHLGGDECLRRVADAMVRCLRRPSDFLGRYGGEEFIAVLPNTDAVGAKIVAERLRAAVEALAIPHEASSCGFVVTTTVGFASFRVLADDQPDMLIGAADGALLQAMAQGRNRVGGVAPLVRPSRISAQRWQRYAPVYVDPWFADRMPAFLESVEQEARTHLETVRNGERRGVVTLQRLRQTACDMAMRELERHLDQLEDGVHDGDLVVVRAAAEAVIQYATHVQVIYRRPRGSTDTEHLAQSA